MKNTSRILRTWKSSLDNPRICNEIMIKDVCCMVDVFLTQWLLCGYRTYPQNLRYLRIQDNEIWTLMMPHLTSNGNGGRVRKFFFWRGGEGEMLTPWYSNWNFRIYWIYLQHIIQILTQKQNRSVKRISDLLIEHYSRWSYLTTRKHWKQNLYRKKTKPTQMCFKITNPTGKLCFWPSHCRYM